MRVFVRRETAGAAADPSRPSRAGAVSIQQELGTQVRRSFGAKVRQVRERRKLSQPQLAARVSMLTGRFHDQEAMALLEGGGHATSVDELYALAAALAVSVIDLVE